MKKVAFSVDWASESLIESRYSSLRSGYCELSGLIFAVGAANKRNIRKRELMKLREEKTPLNVLYLRFMEEEK